MKELANREELVKLIELYKTSKITSFALESELGRSFTEMVEPNIIKVTVINEVEGNTNSTFGVTSIPEKTGERLSLNLLIDRDAIKNLVSASDILKLAEGELKDHQKTFKLYTKFVSDNEGNEVLLSKALVLFLEIYKNSLERFYKEIPEVAEKLSNERTIQSIQSISSEMEAANEESENIRFIIERLTVSKKFPLAFVEAAKQLSKEISAKGSGDEKIPLFYTDEKPVMNQFYQQRRALSDGTYTAEKMNRIIDPNYVPPTNQGGGK
jgi:hypothetical protein